MSRLFERSKKRHPSFCRTALLASTPAEQRQTSQPASEAASGDEDEGLWFDRVTVDSGEVMLRKDGEPSPVFSDEEITCNSDHKKTDEKAPKRECRKLGVQFSMKKIAFPKPSLTSKLRRHDRRRLQPEQQPSESRHSDENPNPPSVDSAEALPSPATTKQNLPPPKEVKTPERSAPQPPPCAVSPQLPEIVSKDGKIGESLKRVHTVAQMMGFAPLDKHMQCERVLILPQAEAARVGVGDINAYKQIMTDCFYRIRKMSDALSILVPSVFSQRDVTVDAIKELARRKEQMRAALTSDPDVLCNVIESTN